MKRSGSQVPELLRDKVLDSKLFRLSNSQFGDPGKRFVFVKAAEKSIAEKITELTAVGWR